MELLLWVYWLDGFRRRSYNMYIQIKNIITSQINSVQRLTDMAFIPFDPANTDYQKFKIDLSNGVQLNDANNNVMTSDQVTAFIATLP